MRFYTPPMAALSLSHHPLASLTPSPMHSLTVVSLSRLATFRYYPRDQYQWLDFVERENVRHCIEVRDGACLYYYYTVCMCVCCVCCVCVLAVNCVEALYKSVACTVRGVYSPEVLLWCVQSCFVCCLRGTPVPL